MEQVSGGLIPRRDECRHRNQSATGETKVENGVVYYQLKCDVCGALFWVKQNELFAPADVVG